MPSTAGREPAREGGELSGADQDYVYGAIVRVHRPPCATGYDGHQRFSYAWLNVICIGTGIHNDLVVLGRRKPGNAAADAARLNCGLN